MGCCLPDINRPTGGKVIGISTGRRGTLFEQIWNDAHWEYGGEKGAGRNMFKGIFLPWHVDPRRTREWYEQTKETFPITEVSIRQLPQMPSQQAPGLLFLSGIRLSMYHTGKSGIRLATGGLSLPMTAGITRQPPCGLPFLQMAG